MVLSCVGVIVGCCVGAWCGGVVRKCGVDVMLRCVVLLLLWS